MKLAIVLSVIGAFVAVSSVYKMSTAQTTNQVPEHVKQMFNSWKSQYERGYGVDAEEAYRLQVFNENYNTVNSLNARGGASFELNKFGDMTKEEFKKTYLGAQQDDSLKTNVESLNTLKLSDEVDWSSNGAVSPIKDQGQCGSCYAFSATGALEGLAYVSNNYLWYFSEQQIVDCAKSYGNAGCSGGLMSHVFQYTAAKGINMESEYPYTSVDTASCNSSVERQARKVNSSYTDVPTHNNNEMMAAITKQPISVGVEADDWQFYKNGVFDNWDTCGEQLNHGVLAVGYGTDSSSGKMYYKIKNSWGASWGQNGYIYLERKVTNDAGLCGVLINGSYPNA